MSDGPRNEKARERHRRMKKETCISVPSSQIALEASHMSLAKQEEYDEQNYFGWTVFERTQADREYQRLMHHESLDKPPVNFGVSPKTPRSLKPGYTKRDFHTKSAKRGHHTPDGPRNEVARLRHRDLGKDDNCCKSVTNSVMTEGNSDHIIEQELNENNHFGWAVYGKAYGDPEFEKLVQFYEKPDINENKFQKRTYVLYLKDGTVVGHDTTEGKEDPNVTPVGDLVTESHEFRPKDKEKKKNLISEFFFLPAEEQSRSRSPKAGKSMQKLLGQLTDRSHLPEHSNKVQETLKEAGDDVSIYSSPEKVVVKNKNKTKKRGSLKQYLRAGGESNKRIITGNENSSVLQNVSGIVNYGCKFIENVKQSVILTSTRAISSGYLIETPSGTNKYLYLSKRNIINHKRKLSQI